MKNLNLMRKNQDIIFEWGKEENNKNKAKFEIEIGN